ncbi:hypothetical protein [Hymenobacter rubripertinctus]|uniref:hypothetical protein n=1 Tax=Hymenobacter rubripertinctus TaxID=2029981 RepID=UPI0016000D93|nr:hypothetical protein [Hymenobacter rubripertinctus]
MKKLLLLSALLLGLLWLVCTRLPPALPAPRHLAIVPVVRKPNPVSPAPHKHVSLPE